MRRTVIEQYRNRGVTEGAAAISDRARTSRRFFPSASYFTNPPPALGKRKGGVWDEKVTYVLSESAEAHENDQ